MIVFNGLELLFTIQYHCFYELIILLNFALTLLECSASDRNFGCRCPFK